MVNVNEMFPTNYLSAGDLQGRSVVVTMAKLTFEDVGQSRDRKPVLYFEGKEKGLVLNKTNTNAIAKAYGGESDNWLGKQIEIYPSETDFQGEVVPCLRVRVPGTHGSIHAAAPLQQGPGQEAAQNNGGGPIDDEIPFSPLRDLP